MGNVITVYIDSFETKWDEYYTAAKAEELQITYSTAQRGIQKLEDAKIIKKINRGKGDIIYCAAEILTILKEPAKININSQ